MMGAVFMPENTARSGSIAILWRGDEQARRAATPATSRFEPIFRALGKLGINAETVVYEDNVIDAVRAQLIALSGVLVWVNPIHEGRNRAKLGALLREAASRGIWVSAHPDRNFRLLGENVANVLGGSDGRREFVSKAALSASFQKSRRSRDICMD
jgi:hypothetical protein